MKRKLTFFASAMACLIITACTNNPALDTAQKNDTTAAGAIGNPEKQQPPTFDLLQGKWQSDDDKTTFLVFAKNHRREISEGMQSWDDEEFILKDQCENESDKSDQNPKEKDRYISCAKSDLCWYIVSVTSAKLTLQYMGRGNTLNYTRVKE